MADIDLTGLTFSHALIERFSGTFDGNGHVIQGFHIDEPFENFDRCGLFGTVDANSLVCNLALDGSRLSVGPGANAVGLLVGWNEGRIEYCTVGGRVLGGAERVGGLVGMNAGDIANCRTSAVVRAEAFGTSVGGLAGENTGSLYACSVTATTLSGGYYVGGLTGFNTGPDATVEDSYAQGSVEGHSFVGGLLGVLEARSSRYPITTTEPAATIRNCYTTCSVVGSDSVGGAVGTAPPSAVVEACYFLTPADSGGPDNGFGTPLSLVDMRRQASFPEWDFDNTWTICQDHDSPRLQWESVDCPP